MSNITRHTFRRGNLTRGTTSRAARAAAYRRADSGAYSRRDQSAAAAAVSADLQTEV